MRTSIERDNRPARRASPLVVQARRARGSTQKLFLARAIARRIQAILVVAVVDAIVVVVLVLVAFLGEETTRFLSCK